MLDFCVKTIYCHECTLHKKDDINSDKHKQWYRDHASNCSINYEGSSGATECQAGVDMFLRSITTRNLRYIVFGGDGDSACYGKVSNACTDMYGDSYYVTKEECVAHLRKYKRKKKGQKLCNNKFVGGAGRLTDAFIDRI